MAHSKLYFENTTTGEERYAPVGFSWTSFFFGFFPCAWRQDWLAAIVIFCLSVLTSMVGGWLALWILQGFFYNKWYITKLIEKGFTVKASEGKPLDMLEKDLGMRLPRTVLNG